MKEDRSGLQHICPQKLDRPQNTNNRTARYIQCAKWEKNAAKNTLSVKTVIQNKEKGKEF